MRNFEEIMFRLTLIAGFVMVASMAIMAAKFAYLFISQ